MTGKKACLYLLNGEEVVPNEITFNVTCLLAEHEKYTSPGVYDVYRVSLQGKAIQGMTWEMWRESTYTELFVEEINSKLEGLLHVRSNDYGGFWVDPGTPLCVDCAGVDYEEYTGSAQTITREELPAILSGDSIIQANHNYSLGAWLVFECVTPDSVILNSLNGTTTLAKDIKENDDIAYYNFEKDTVEIGKVSKVYIHKNATKFIRYTFEDGSYLEATDYHPIYTNDGWKSQTNRNGYEKPQIGDKVKTENGWKKIIIIEEYIGKEDCYDFAIVSKDGKKIDNYFANGTLVQNSIK